MFYYLNMENNKEMSNDKSGDKRTLTLCMLAKSEICAPSAGCFINVLNSRELKHLVNLEQHFSLGQSGLPKARSYQTTVWFKKAKPGDVFMFIDSDQTFTDKDIITSLSYIDKGCSVVCGAYQRKSGNMTVEPKNVSRFFDEKEGDLWYGSTGFMMITYEILEKIVKNVGPPIAISSKEEAYPFFYERTVVEPEISPVKLWLSEDYSFCWLARVCKGRVFGYISPTIGHILPTETFVEIPKLKKWDKKSIVIYCGKTSEQWSAKSVERGIGGSELSVINLSKLWVKRGWSVTVFCYCDEPGIYEGVHYRHITDFSVMDIYDILILWRVPEFLNFIKIESRKCLIDFHDIVKSDRLTQKVLDRADYFCVKSEYHKKLLPNTVESEKICVIPNGGGLEMYGKVKDEHYKKLMNAKDLRYLIYTSSYDRGLYFILKWCFPLIKKACPDVYFKVFYGWEGFDKAHAQEIASGNEDAKVFKDAVQELLKQDGVEECGRVSHERLLKEKEKANIHLYTGDFQEIDCISVRESASVGCIPVVSEYVEVFKEKPYCIKVEGDPRVKETQEKVAEVIIQMLTNVAETNAFRETMDTSNETWEKVASKWVALFKKNN
jgi:hypothetical protein